MQQSAKRRSRAFVTALIAGTCVLATGLVASGVSSAAGDKADDASTLVVASIGTPPTVDLDDTGGKPQGWEIANNIYGKAASYPITADGQRNFLKYVPGLYKSWNRNADGSVWTFDLRRGVKSCAGNTMTSADVVWSAQRWFATKKLGALVAGFMNVTSASQVTAVDQYTVRFTLNAPSALVLPVLALGRAAIFDSTEVKKHTSSSDPWGSQWLSTNGAGFGPYCLDSLTPGTEAVLSANPNYWDGVPPIKRIVYRAVPDASNRAALLKNGDVDIALALPPDQLTSLEKRKGITITNTPGTAVFSLLLNNLAGPLGNTNFRKALLWATPYDQILTDIYKGKYAQATKGTVAPRWPGYSAKVWPYKTDLVKAKAALKASKIKTPVKLGLTFAVLSPTDEQVAVLLKSAYAKIGVKMNIKIITPAENGTTLATHNFETMLYRLQPQAIDSVYGSEVYAGKGLSTNWTNYHYQAVWDVFDKIRSEILTRKRIAAETQIQALEAKNPGWVPLLTQNYVVAHTSAVKGIVWQNDEGLLFWELSKS